MQFGELTWLGVGESVPKPLIPVLAMFKIPGGKKMRFFVLVIWAFFSSDRSV